MQAGDVVVYHDGNGGHHNALVFAQRSDLQLGTKGQPALTLATVVSEGLPVAPSVAVMEASTNYHFDVPHLSAVAPNDDPKQLRGWSLSLDPKLDAPQVIAKPKSETDLLKEKIAHLEAELAGKPVPVEGAKTGFTADGKPTSDATLPAAPLPAPVTVAGAPLAARVEAQPAGAGPTAPTA